MKRKIGICVLLLFFQSINVWALKKDYLEVPEHVFSLRIPLNEYLLKVRKILMTGEQRYPYVRMVVIPSLKPEWMVNIQNPQGDTALVVYTIAEEQIWGKKQWESLRAVYFTAEIPANVAENIREIYLEQLHRVQYPQGEGTLSDEHLYYLSAYIDGEGILTGEKMIMDRQTETGELIQMGRNLREYVLAEEDSKRLYLKKIEQAIRQLKRNKKKTKKRNKK